MTDVEDIQEDAVEPASEAIDPVAFVRGVTSAQNLVSGLPPDVVAGIGSKVMEDYTLDKNSMGPWIADMEAALKMATMEKDGIKTTPYVNAANVRYPLVASAVMQFNARAFPAVVPADSPVKARVWGKDSRGDKAARAERVSEHMSWYLLAKVPEWQRSTDELLMQLPAVGEVFRKWWYDPGLKRLRCRLVKPGKFIVNSNATDLETVPRCTEELSFYPNEITTRIRRGAFVDFEFLGTDIDDKAPQDFIEQHTRIDLDKDGYEEPYIVTMHVASATVVRIVADFGEEDVDYSMGTAETEDEYGIVRSEQVATGIEEIRRGTYFADYRFMPDVRGGFHGIGLGILLKDISATVDTLLNMLIDAGKFNTLGGGFIGSGFRIKGGATGHRPGEWRQVEAPGGVIKDSIVPMTLPKPDQVLFSLLGMMVDAGREISSVKDVLTGEAPNRQQTATATLALIEQGLSVFTAIYKRFFESATRENAIIARLIRDTVSDQEYSAFHDAVDETGQPVLFETARDYGFGDMDIQPVADVQSVTNMQKTTKAQLLMQLAESGMVDRGEALFRVAEAAAIPDVEALMPKPDPAAEEAQKLQMAAARAGLAKQSAEIMLTLAKVDSERAAVMRDLAAVENDQDRLGLEQKKAQFDALLRILENERAGIGQILGTGGGMEVAPGYREIGAGDGMAFQPNGGGFVPPMGIGGAGAGFGAGGFPPDS